MILIYGKSLSFASIEKMNMKKLLTLLILVLLGCVLAFGQDSLYIGTPQMDTLRGDLIDCYGYQCSPTVSHTYIIASSYNGAIDIGGDGLAEVLIMTENYIHFDTCAVLTQWAGMELRLLFDFPASARIVINSYEGATVTVFSKTDSAVTRQLPAPIAFTDTLCAIPTAIDEPIKPMKSMYFDPITLQKVVTLEPNKAYIVRYGIQ